MCRLVWNWCRMDRAVGSGVGSERDNMLLVVDRCFPYVIPSLCDNGDSGWSVRVLGLWRWE